MFKDEASFIIHAGKGGDGAVSFRRERYVPRGGPDGGDGGNGGHVEFVGKHDIHTLSDFRSRQIFEAEDGQNGTHKKMHGKNGENCILYVPLGTKIAIKSEKEPIESAIINEIEILEDAQRVVLARGGNGGWGNAHFATSIKQAPEWSKKGLEGQEFTVNLELQLIADVGLVGLPNAGKSTYLASVTNARPKIANYPFTTLEPQLGVASIGDTHLVIADIPGLIEGASQNKGLGHEFLKHIKRTKTLLMLIDSADENPQATIKTLKSELDQYDHELSQKSMLLAFTKIDTIDDEVLENLKKKFKEAYFISAVAHTNIKELLFALSANVTLHTDKGA